MDKIWYRNPSKSEVIGHCGGDDKNEWPRRTDKSRTLKKKTPKTTQTSGRTNITKFFLQVMCELKIAQLKRANTLSTIPSIGVELILIHSSISFLRCRSTTWPFCQWSQCAFIKGQNVGRKFHQEQDYVIKSITTVEREVRT